MDIFKEEEFTLKELCYYFINNINKINLFQRSKIHNELLDVCKCYILFTSNDSKYRKYLYRARASYCCVYSDNLEKIYIREILQYFDFDFNKLIVRISVEKNNNDIKVSWKQVLERYKNTDDLIIKESIKLDLYGN